MKPRVITRCTAETYNDHDNSRIIEVSDNLSRQGFLLELRRWRKCEKDPWTLLVLPYSMDERVLFRVPEAHVELTDKEAAAIRAHVRRVLRKLPQRDSPCDR